jgi:long-chain acyl-CoA synthetase
MNSRTAENIVEAFESWAEKHSGKTAIIYLGTKYSYSRINEWVRRFAAALQGLGVREGDKMVIYIPNSPQWTVAWLAILKIGDTAVPIAPMYNASELEYIVNA